MRALAGSLFFAFISLQGCNCGENLGEVPGDITGHVCHADSGAPLIGAAVKIAAVKGAVQRSTISDGLGKYTLTATLGSETRTFPVDVSANEKDNQPPKDDTACRAQPENPGDGGLTGQVCNRHTGGFVSQADVIVELPNAQQMATQTDDQGRFSLANIPAGTYVVEIRGDGYQRSFSVTITDGGSFDLDLAQDCNSVSATEGGMVGEFCDPTQGATSNLVGATVTATAATAGVDGGTDTTDTNGQFEINGLTPGDYRVDVVGSDAHFTIPVVTVTAGAEVTVTDTADCGEAAQKGRIQGQICDTDAGGHFVGDVDLLDVASNIVQSTVSDSTGRFVFNQVDVGTYSVHAHRDPSFSRTFTDVVVQAFLTTSIQEDSCPAPQQCSDFTNQPSAQADGRIFLVVDRSGSMGENGSDGNIKWNSIKQALEQVTASLQ
ncbi:MAG TPA: carboxypeptidase regulatory-like domain-containing protein, partial [Myxococcota bacterium]